MICSITSYDQLPLTLCAEHISQILGISRSATYTLLRSKGFPTIYIGKRMVVPKDKFIAGSKNRQPGKSVLGMDYRKASYIGETKNG